MKIKNRKLRRGMSSVDKAIKNLAKAREELHARRREIEQEHATLNEEEADIREKLLALDQVMTAFPPAVAPSGGTKAAEPAKKTNAGPTLITEKITAMMANIVDAMSKSDPDRWRTTNDVKSLLGLDPSKPQVPVLKALKAARETHSPLIEFRESRNSAGAKTWEYRAAKAAQG